MYMHLGPNNAAVAILSFAAVKTGNCYALQACLLEACKLPVLPAVKCTWQYTIGMYMHLGPDKAAVAIYALLLSKLATAAPYKLAFCRLVSCQFCHQ